MIEARLGCPQRVEDYSTVFEEVTITSKLGMPEASVRPPAPAVRDSANSKLLHVVICDNSWTTRVPNRAYVVQN